MTRHRHARYALMIAGLLASAGMALASEAETSASASGGRGQSGTASATAHYAGRIGFARTDTRTGALNIARGVALGVDRDGLSLSLSTAIAPQYGPAIATNYNISIGTNGEVARSGGRVESRGGSYRMASVAGRADTGDRYRPAVAVSQASGQTRFGGVVHANSRSSHDPARLVAVRRVFRPRP